jgi:hypothetical protein
MEANRNSAKQLGIEEITYFPSFGFFPAGDDTGELMRVFKVDEIKNPADKWLIDYVIRFKADVDESGYLLMTTVDGTNDDSDDDDDEPSDDEL